jgi:hypothetical protein
MIFSDSIQLSSSDNEGPCDFEDHQYSSPSEDSDNDNKIVEMDFAVFSIEDSQFTDEDPEDPVTSNTSNQGVGGVGAFPRSLFYSNLHFFILIFTFLF